VRNGPDRAAGGRSLRKKERPPVPRSAAHYVVLRHAVRLGGTEPLPPVASALLRGPAWSAWWQGTTNLWRELAIPEYWDARRMGIVNLERTLPMDPRDMFMLAAAEADEAVPNVRKPRTKAHARWLAVFDKAHARLSKQSDEPHSH